MSDLRSTNQQYNFNLDIQEHINVPSSRSHAPVLLR